MSDMKKEEKKYTAEEVAKIVLKKAQEMIEASALYKSNNSHEVENGEEPYNEDSECPEYLCDADIEEDFKEDDKRKKKKSPSDSSEDSEFESEEDSEFEEEDSDSDEPEHEKDLSPEENKEHDAAENEADEEDEDNIEADEEDEDNIEADEEEEVSEEIEEDAAEDKDTKEIISEASEDKKEDKDKDKKKKPPFAKSENGLSKLKKFIEDREDRLEKAHNSSQPARTRDYQIPVGVRDAEAKAAARGRQSKFRNPNKKKIMRNKGLKNKKLEKKRPGVDISDDVNTAAKPTRRHMYPKLKMSENKLKNKKMEKMLGMSNQSEKQDKQAPMKPQEPLKPGDSFKPNKMPGNGIKGY